MSPSDGQLHRSAKPTTRRRAEIPAELRWDFTPIYSGWEAWEEDVKAMKAQSDAFAAMKGTLHEGPRAVLAAYRLYDEIGKRQYRIYCYPQLQRDVDTRDQEVAGRLQSVQAMLVEFDAATAWFKPELLSVPHATMTRWIADTPELAPYGLTILDNYRRQAHVLDEKGERLLALAQSTGRSPVNAYTELSTSDIKFPTLVLADGGEVLLSRSNYAALLETSPNQAERAQAAALHIGAYAAHAHTYAALYAAVLQRDWFTAQARNFASTLDAVLDDHAIPAAVVKTLVETTRAGTAPLQRYARLRRQLLKLDEYHLHDAFVSVVRRDEVYPYEQARELVLASVAPLGQDYVARYRRFVAGGRIDVYENEGKKGGAYNAGVYGVGPYLLLNYSETLGSVFTFAHEAGHAMHTVLSYEHQPFVSADCSPFVAEVASITNERFLLDELLRRTTDAKARFLLLQHAADAIVRTFYSPVMLATFELEAHQRVERGESVTTEVLCSLYAELLRAWYGDAVVLDDCYRYSWARISHFYDSPYYVYQYATSFAASARLYDAMATGTPAARTEGTERYLTLLKSGGNDLPMAQLRKAGVDLTQREPVQAVVLQLERLVTQLEQEATRIGL